MIAGVAALIFGAEADSAQLGRLVLSSAQPATCTPVRGAGVAGCLCMSCAGPSKLPELGKGLGKTVKSFQTAAKVSGKGGSSAQATKKQLAPAGCANLQRLPWSLARSFGCLAWGPPAPGTLQPSSLGNSGIGYFPPHLWLSGTVSPGWMAAWVLSKTL